MKDEKINIGDMLRRRRAEKKISLAEAQSITKINKKFLEAMEEENFKLIPTKVAAKGFLKIYALYLGIDPKMLLDEYEAIAPEEKPLQKVPPKPPAPDTIKATKNLLSRFKFSRRLIYTIVFIVSILVFMFLYIFMGHE